MSSSVKSIDPIKSRITFPTVGLGVYLDRPPHLVPDGGMTDCYNVRIDEGKLRNDLMGWELFGTSQQTDSPISEEGVLLVNYFTAMDGTSKLIVGTKRDLFEWSGSAFLYLTPRHSTDLVTVNSGSPTVDKAAGTDWDATNCRAGDMFYVGAADSRASGGAWYEIQSRDSAIQLTLTTNCATTGGGLGYTIRNVFSGDLSNIWQSAVFPDAAGVEDLWIATNGTGNEIVKWNGITTTVTEIGSTLGFTCGTVGYLNNMMLYGNLLESGASKPSSVRNSAIAAPENVSTLEAGEWVIADGIDFLRALVPLGDSIIGYCEKSVNRATFVGGDTSFQVDWVLPDTGIVASRAYATFGHYHEFLSNDRAYRFDGVSIQEFAPHVFREVLRTLDPNRAEKVMSFVVKEEGDVHWVIPKTTDGTGTNGAPLVAYTEHYLELVGSNHVPMTIRSLPATANGTYVDSSTKLFSDLTDDFDDYDIKWNDRQFSEAFPSTLFGDEDGNVWTLGTTSSHNGASVESWGRFGRRPLIDGNSKGLVHRIEPRAEERPQSSAYGLGVILWTSDHPEGTLTRAHQSDFDLTQAGDRFVPVRQVGRHAEVEFATTGVSRSFAISGFSVVVSEVGSR